MEKKDRIGLSCHIGYLTPEHEITVLFIFSNTSDSIDILLFKSYCYLYQSNIIWHLFT